MKKVSHQQLAQWLEQARRGDERAFRALYDATAPAQYSQALAVVKDPELAREAVQDSYLSFYRSMGRIQSSQAVVAYLNKTTHYASLALLRREKRPPEEDTDLFALPDAPENGPEEQVLTADRRHRLQAALAELSPRQRQAVQLRYYQRQKLDQVAHSMQCSRSTVQRLLRDAHAALRRSLGGGLLAVLPLGAVLRSAQKPPLSPPWRQKVAAAAVASTVLLTAAVWSAQSPTIRTARVLAQYPANTAAVEVSLSGRTADSLTLVGPQGRRQPFVRRRDGRYTAAVSQNGGYLVEAAAGQKVVTRPLTVQGLDTAAPQLTAVCRDGGDTLLTVVDQDTGIDWSTLSVSSSVGQLYRPVSVDDGTGTARFALPPGRYTLQVGDKAGNAASGPLQVLG
ncbi:sigma-70 family RNA polymerase sigma factor [Neobittarella massiliensis]|uniref:Sigma-70 family RNA polymerase sigma factor n=1 Tax=Neobittarella massiliensis (ex Bilen et al. 2018) TaxID=2041842 RepID=A0A8J6IPN4_9FIRM|nr:sigma-70 family RNA polymerase sigma factor [Neobittarella massiliensis]MBC3516238.1 sigma-70 family RNA polymerase sigma factor [Neobittarella massiliensis]